ncbi:hypothetical protein CEXT_256681 [Caerostris extrusa]|uniref:Uncharacterized protein n=1 Tax=Caerostris extrusa TaxID=172846 RepID=A0AAV4QKN8_CAEEX|nr:hypothetical protein CEXT_256681 [Caerostris extrusa]
MLQKGRWKGGGKKGRWKGGGGRKNVVVQGKEGWWKKKVVEGKVKGRARQGKGQGGGGKGRCTLSCALLCAGACLCYRSALDCGFVFDDVSAIRENRDLRPSEPLVQSALLQRFLGHAHEQGW